METNAISSIIYFLKEQRRKKVREKNPLHKSGYTKEKLSISTLSSYNNVLQKQIVIDANVNILQVKR